MLYLTKYTRLHSAASALHDSYAWDKNVFDPLLNRLMHDTHACYLIVCSYRIYDDDIVEPGMLGSTAINRCMALSEFDVSDVHITNHSTSADAATATANHSMSADAATAGPVSSNEHLNSDQSSVVSTLSVYLTVAVFHCSGAVVGYPEKHKALSYVSICT